MTKGLGPLFLQRLIMPSCHFALILMSLKTLLKCSFSTLLDVSIPPSDIDDLRYFLRTHYTLSSSKGFQHFPSVGPMHALHGSYVHTNIFNLLIFYTTTSVGSPLTLAHRVFISSSMPTWKSPHRTQSKVLAHSLCLLNALLTEPPPLKSLELKTSLRTPCARVQSV